MLEGVVDVDLLEGLDDTAGFCASGKQNELQVLVLVCKMRSARCLSSAVTS